MKADIDSIANVGTILADGDGTCLTVNANRDKRATLCGNEMLRELIAAWDWE